MIIAATAFEAEKILNGVAGVTGVFVPRAGWRLEALPAFAASGALYSSGFPHRPPCSLPGYLAHDCAAIAAVTGALVAVLDRARHGAGQTVEVAVQGAPALPRGCRLPPASMTSPSHTSTAKLLLP